MKLTNNKLTPSKGKHLKSIVTGDVYESCIYLGIYDSKDNYVEVSEEEYQEYLSTLTFIGGPSGGDFNVEEN